MRDRDDKKSERNTHIETNTQTDRQCLFTFLTAAVTIALVFPGLIRRAATCEIEVEMKGREKAREKEGETEGERERE